MIDGEAILCAPSPSLFYQLSTFNYYHREKISFAAFSNHKLKIVLPMTLIKSPIFQLEVSNGLGCCHGTTRLNVALHGTGTILDRAQHGHNTFKCGTSTVLDGHGTGMTRLPGTESNLMSTTYSSALF